MNPASAMYLIGNDINDLALYHYDLPNGFPFDLSRNCTDCHRLLLQAFLITSGICRELSAQLPIYLHNDLNDILHQFGFIIGRPWLIVPVPPNTLLQISSPICGAKQANILAKPLAYST